MHPDQQAKPATSACALTENQTLDLLLCRMTPSQLSHTGQGRPVSVLTTGMPGLKF